MYVIPIVTLFEHGNVYYDKTPIGQLFKATTTILNQVSEIEHGGVPRKRTTTSRFTENQLSILKKRFRNDPYIKKPERELFAKYLGVTQNAIDNWFQKERVRQKRYLANEACNATVL